ncbi:MAG: ABC transporter substrate-binding protein [Chloroflexi bacterium]|nr:ABC transporter substrate-binding protein [Chloroflexota bacterium]
MYSRLATQAIMVAVMTLLVASLVATACAPKTAPAPAPATLATTAAAGPAIPTPTFSPPVSQDPAWARVIEVAKKEGKVSIYSFNFTGDAGIAISRSFEGAYGIKADIITGRGAEFLERVKTEQRLGQRVGDIFEGSVAHSLNAKTAGLLAPSMDIAVLKARGDFLVDPLGIDKEGYILNESYISYAPYINTNLVKPGQEPKSWSDFLDPRWKGKIIANDPQISVTWYNALVPLVNSGILKIDFVRDMGKQDLMFATGDYEVIQKLAQGQAPITMISPDIVAGSTAAEGAPIKAIPMAEGVTVSTTALAAIKDSPHPNAAKLFINWLLSAEGQTAFHKARSTAPIRKDVQDFRHPNVRLPATVKLVVVGKDDADDSAKKFRDKYYPELWKK